MLRPLFRGHQGDEWGALAARLPAGWEAQATVLGALTRRRVFRTATELFQALCCLVVGQCSLLEATVWLQRGGGPHVSAVALHKRLRACGPWAAWILQQLCGRAQTRLPGWDRRVLVADATVITGPGSCGTDYRIHGLLNLGDFRWAGCAVTDATGGEHLHRWTYQPGDLVLADRGYATASNVAAACAQGADVLIRWKRSHSGLRTVTGDRCEPLHLVAHLPPRQRVAEWPTALLTADERLLPGRLIALRTAGDWVFLWTTLPPTVRASRVAELYRARWQIELVFKRFKSLGEVDDLPNRRPDTAQAWLLVACAFHVLLDDWAAEQAVALPPPARRCAA